MASLISLWVISKESANLSMNFREWREFPNKGLVFFDVSYRMMTSVTDELLQSTKSVHPF